MTNLNDFPAEILEDILAKAAELNRKENVSFTYGLSQPLGSEQRGIQKYIRGPVPPELQRWDAVLSIREVCTRWHEWSLQYALKDVYVKCWRGSERWCDLPVERRRYRLYELNPHRRGEKVYRDAHLTLTKTRNLFTTTPSVASHVRRLNFDGLYVPETDAKIIEIASSCSNLTSISIPWTVLRHGTASDWAQLLGTCRKFPLRSLELLCLKLGARQAEAAEAVDDERPLDSRMVNFSQLKRLKLFGDATFQAIGDEDLQAIARTATSLEEFQITNMSTVTMEGVMAIVKASQKTLRLLEHSPRSQEGFLHPDPGNLSEKEHICDILTSCPKLEDLSISIPSMCADLFSNKNVRWKGNCQVRALHLCGHEEGTTSNASIVDMKALLKQARELITNRANVRYPAHLTVELFFADVIFDPHNSSVHGDFSPAEEVSLQTWPANKSLSRKGPYGSTGLYGKKDEEHPFDRVNEDDFFEGVARTLLNL
ncbi:D-lactate dehydrogenase [Venturia nashicola]|uniref:D-lactate dehydrogenase n=1 Tax=Venturia nashicola TaxID=86259 RepID=A0A4Z1NS38_9PEZI|nr:D-lactate dehydrogenase [Venturia nashicola]TLD26051.1 D-lactate dehydrogenase [Venturia nashicola]